MADEKLIIVMVGLPARGKSYITKKISNYCQWLNIHNRIFNVGNKRRHICEDEQNADFFDPSHEKNVQVRDQLAMETLDDLLEYLSGDGQIGIFDATNSTFKRRRKIINYVHEQAQSRGFKDYNILFLESICNDKNIIEQNMMLKLNGPDYKDQDDKQAALDDFKQRLSNYETVYETVSTKELCHDARCQYMKIIDIHNLRSFNIQGFLPIMLNNFLQHYNITQKKIWISLPHIGHQDINPIVDTANLYIINTSLTTDNTISPELNVDQVHDLILHIEASHKDVLVQTQDELLINGILKYFDILDNCHPDLTTHILCILPRHYSVGLQQFNTHEIPEMTRSNSNISTCSSLITPREDLDWTKFNYQNLNLSELSSKLQQLE